MKTNKKEQVKEMDRKEISCEKECGCCAQICENDL